MKLSHYEIAEACAAGDYVYAAELVRRNSTGDIVGVNVAAFPIFVLTYAGNFKSVPVEVQVWLGMRCWFWNNITGFGNFNALTPADPSKCIRIKKWGRPGKL